MKLLGVSSISLTLVNVDSLLSDIHSSIANGRTVASSSMEKRSSWLAGSTERERERERESPESLAVYHWQKWRRFI